MDRLIDLTKGLVDDEPSIRHPRSGTMDDGLNDLTKCNICMERFGSTYRHLDSYDVMRENRVPIQSMVCTHNLCFPCVEGCVLSSLSTGARRVKSAVKCPVCMVDKAFSISGQVNLTACALSKVVEERERSSAAAPTPLDGDFSKGPSDSGKAGATRKSSSASAKRPPSAQAENLTSGARNKKKKKAKAKVAPRSSPAVRRAKEPPPRAAATATATTTDLHLALVLDERPVRQRSKSRTITDEWNADHERKLAAQDMAPDWDVLSRNAPGNAYCIVGSAEGDSRQSSTTDGARGSSYGSATATAASGEHGSVPNSHGLASEDAFRAALGPGEASTENPPTFASDHTGAPSALESHSPLPVDKDAAATSPTMSHGIEDGDSKLPPSSPSESGCANQCSASVDAAATCQDSHVDTMTSTVEGMAPATASGTSEALSASTLALKQLASASNTNIATISQSQQEPDDLETASVIEVDAPPREPASIYSIDDDDDDDDESNDLETDSVIEVDAPPREDASIYSISDGDESDDLETASVMEVDAPPREAPSIYSISDDDDDDQSSASMEEDPSPTTSSVPRPVRSSEPSSIAFAEIGTASTSTSIPAGQKRKLEDLRAEYNCCPTPAEESNDAPQPTSIMPAGTTTKAATKVEIGAVHEPSAPAAGTLSSSETLSSPTLPPAQVEPSENKSSTVVPQSVPSVPLDVMVSVAISYSDMAQEATATPGFHDVSTHLLLPTAQNSRTEPPSSPSLVETPSIESLTTSDVSKAADAEEPLAVTSRNPHPDIESSSPTPPPAAARAPSSLSPNTTKSLRISPGQQLSSTTLGASGVHRMAQAIPFEKAESSSNTNELLQVPELHTTPPHSVELKSQKSPVSSTSSRSFILQALPSSEVVREESSTPTLPRRLQGSSPESSSPYSQQPVMVPTQELASVPLPTRVPSMLSPPGESMGSDTNRLGATQPPPPFSEAVPSLRAASPPPMPPRPLQLQQSPSLQRMSPRLSMPPFPSPLPLPITSSSSCGGHGDANSADSSPGKDVAEDGARHADDEGANIAKPPASSGESALLPPETDSLFVDSSLRQEHELKDDVLVIDLTGDDTEDDGTVIDLTGDDDTVDDGDCDEIEGM